MDKVRAALYLFAALLFVAAFAPRAEAATPLEASLRVTVTGVTPAGGTLRVELHDEATFSDPAASPLRNQDIAHIAGDVSVMFQALPPGVYAVKAFQDVNDNGKADAGEPAGNSNDAALGNFDAAAIEVDPGVNMLTIHLR